MTYIKVVSERFWCILADFHKSVLVLQVLDSMSHPLEWVDVWLWSRAQWNPAKMDIILTNYAGLCANYVV